MKISALEEYGLRCLVSLGRCDNGNSLTINEIATKEGLTVPNVRKLMMLLREAGLVESVRGRTGGYALKHDARDISVGQIVESLGGRMYDAAFCGRFSGELSICTHSSACSVRSLWAILDDLIGGVLHRIRLSDLIGTDEEQTTVSLRKHLESTVEEMLGDGAAAAPAKMETVQTVRAGNDAI